MAELTVAGDAHALLLQLEKASAEFGLIVTSPGLPEQVRAENLADIEKVCQRVHRALGVCAKDPVES